MDEIEVVKVILLREEYVERAKINLGHYGSKIDMNREALEDLFSLLGLLRIATLDSVEAIKKWRSKGRTGPFVWKGINYLLKIPCDTDFLDNCEVGYMSQTKHFIYLLHLSSSSIFFIYLLLLFWSRVVR